MSVLKAIRSSYFKYFFIHHPLFCLVFKCATKVEADVTALKELTQETPVAGALASARTNSIVQPLLFCLQQVVGRVPLKLVHSRCQSAQTCEFKSSLPTVKGHKTKTVPCLSWV